MQRPEDNLRCRSSCASHPGFSDRLSHWDLGPSIQPSWPAPRGLTVSTSLEVTSRCHYTQPFRLGLCQILVLLLVQEHVPDIISPALGLSLYIRAAKWLCHFQSSFFQACPACRGAAIPPGMSRVRHCNNKFVNSQDRSGVTTPLHGPVLGLISRELLRGSGCFSASLWDFAVC